MEHGRRRMEEGLTGEHVAAAIRNDSFPGEKLRLSRPEHRDTFPLLQGAEDAFTERL